MYKVDITLGEIEDKDYNEVLSEIEKVLYELSDYYYFHFDVGIGEEE